MDLVDAAAPGSTDDAQLQDARATWPLDDEVAMALSPGTSSPEAARSVRDEEAEASRVS